MRGIYRFFTLLKFETGMQLLLAAIKIMGHLNVVSGPLQASQRH